MVKSVVKVGPFGRILAKKWEPAPPATDPFQDVPDEILTMIFRGLGGKELRSVARACKRFARIAQFELCRAEKDKMGWIHGGTWLHQAVHRDNEVMVRRLLAVGATAHTQDRMHRTPLLFAVNNENDVIIRILLNSQSDMDQFCRQDEHVSHAAAYLGDRALFQRAVKALSGGEYMVDVELRVLRLFSKWSGGGPVLHLAVRGGNIDIIQQTIELGVDIDDKGYVSKTALHIAAEKDDKLAVEKLVQLGANRMKRDWNRRTAHSLARHMGNKDAASVLNPKRYRPGRR